MQATEVLDLVSFERLASQRRTSLQIDRDRPLAPATIEVLCRLVATAPNHKRTWPWRLACFTGDGRLALGAAFAAALGAGAEPARIDKARTKYLRAPVVIVIGSAPTAPDRTLEDGYAVAAGIQNLLLGATAAGLASHWSTPPVAEAPAVLELAGFPGGTQVVGIVYLGWPAGEPPAPVRPPLAVHHVNRAPIGPAPTRTSERTTEQ